MNRPPVIPGSDVKVTIGQPQTVRPKCEIIHRVLDGMTPAHLPTYPGTEKVIFDTGAGFFCEPNKWVKSWWKDGWGGPKESVDYDALEQMAMKIAPRGKWILNIEHWPYDIRTAKDEDVERNVDRLRDILRRVRFVRPDIVRGFYASIPPELHVVTHYAKAKIIKDRVERGEMPLSGNEWWLAKFPEFELAYLAWTRSVTRLTYGFDEKTGKLDTGGGLADELDMFNPSTYLSEDVNDGPGDLIDIESDTYFIEAQVKESLRVADGRPVFPCQTPYRKNTGTPIPPHRMENALKATKQAGAHGVAMWLYTGGRPLNQTETSATEMAKRTFEGVVEQR